MVTKSHNLWNNDQKLYRHYSIVMPFLCDACVFLVVNLLTRVRALSATTLWSLEIVAHDDVVCDDDDVDNDDEEERKCELECDGAHLLFDVAFLWNGS